MPLVFKQEAINGILFTLHSQKELSSFAHQKLIEMTGEEVMSQEQVTEFFKKIDKLEFQIKEDVQKVTLAQILNVPNFVENYLDIRTRLRLRKTCKTIREILNEKPLYKDCVNYKYNDLVIEISTDGGFKISYQLIKEGLRVRYWNKEKVINATIGEMVEIIQRDLMSILCSQKLKIDTFEIKGDSYTSGKHPIGELALRFTFNQLPNKLKICNLEYSIEKKDGLLIALLKRIDPEHLKCLTLTNSFSDNISFKDLYNLEQWKGLKSLKVYNWKLTELDDLRFFTHVENAHLEIGIYQWYFPPLQNILMELKDKLLENPNLKQFKIEARYGVDARHVKEIRSIFQQYNTNNAQYPCWVSIPYPDSDKKLQLLVKKKMIWFKGPCYVKGEWEEDSDEEEEKERESDDDEDEDEEVGDYSQELLIGILYTLHLQKDTPIVAHQKLMEMAKEEEVMDLDQVTEFFEKIDNGEFRLKDEVEKMIRFKRACCVDGNGKEQKIADDVVNYFPKDKFVDN
ncbi:hypothetical protein GCK72_011417 [Caenorhabditis remanei]|uniref:DUF38 domain-containing protein n=1 Tax=Caenorhabditis remanei TaxID=31234 RepID=A0A6A5H8G4_CAERE|nr:hypothetical protein GCK72_011417 [Caenorhabditis remanei]KAF1763151.1 hypothetical protein GCK72_011417 [Caenorhabditis remanei]